MRESGWHLSGAMAAVTVGFLVWSGAFACRRAPAVAQTTIDSAHRAADPESCASCHAAAMAAWRGSHHALAETTHGASDPNPPGQFPAAQRWIGVAPLKQLLVQTTQGRLQVSDLAYSPARKDWFSVFGADARQPGDWGHWTGRGMNWNSQCAWCHNTAVSKGYDPATDAYQTRMAHAGVTCAACHGFPVVAGLDRVQMEAACAACHSRRGDLTGEFKPGEGFHDHFGLETLDRSGDFYPDGQVKEEDFEYTAFVGSKMHQAGVSCIDCHEPHSGQVRALGNQLCLTCHSGSQSRFPSAPHIVPAEHTHHAAGSTGDQCVSCHMPVTTYMQRHERRDHGFTIPDPVLTQQTGEPNACNRCHQDRSADWAAGQTARWFGSAMDRPTRARALTLAAAGAGGLKVPAAAEPGGLLRILKGDPNGYWRAVAANLLADQASDPNVLSALEAAARDQDPLVRELAVRALGVVRTEAQLSSDPAVNAAVSSALTDAVRSVRIEAAWALRDQPAPAGRAVQDLERLIAINRDQPAGAQRAGLFDLARGQLPEAVVRFEQAVQWDPISPEFRESLAIAYGLQHRPREAAAQLQAASQRFPQDGHLRFQLGLALSEAGDLEGAAAAFVAATQLAPEQARGWYDLGVARFEQHRWNEAILALRRAVQLDPAASDAADALRQAEAQAGRSTATP